MTKEMEFEKCMALLRKAVRMELITEAEYTIARNKLMDRFLIIREDCFSRFKFNKVRIEHLFVACYNGASDFTCLQG